MEITPLFLLISIFVEFRPFRANSFGAAFFVTGPAALRHCYRIIGKALAVRRLNCDAG